MDLRAGHEYLKASRRVREAFARYTLGRVLHWAFAADGIAALPADELEHVVDHVRDTVSAVEAVWAPVMEAVQGASVTALRGELETAFRRIRATARNVAAGETTARMPVTVQLYVPHPASDREGLPRWSLDGRLGDGLVWAAVKLFAEVPRSLIRPCAFAGCDRIYLASKNQRYCLSHQAEARRAAQREAERSFRARQRATKRRTP